MLAITLPTAVVPGTKPAVELRLSSSFPSWYLQLGQLAARLADKVGALSNGSLRVRFHEPDAVGVGAAHAKRAAIGAGSLDALITASGYFAERESALHLFTGFPFGPDPLESMAWMAHGGGLGLLRALYAEQGLVPIPCATLSGKVSGWCREPIDRVEQLRGMRLRSFGLGAKVFERLGATTQLLSADATREAMAAGTLDGFDAFTPVLDHQLGLHRLAPHCYLPGWQQPAMSFELLIGAGFWSRLASSHRSILETACSALAHEALLESESTQSAALQAMEAGGTQVHLWTVQQLAAFRRAWTEVARAESAADARFARVLQSFLVFHHAYARWQREGHLPAAGPEVEA